MRCNEVGAGCKTAVCEAAIKDFSVKPHVLPILSCILAGLVLCLAPIAIWRFKTGIWALLQWENEYYLQLAAQVYYNHRWFMSDPSSSGGVTFYPWLQFVPAANLAHFMGLSVFSVGVVWAVWAGVFVSFTLYLVFWRFLRSRWLAAGLTVLCVSDRGFCRTTPVLLHIKTTIFALLLHPAGLLNIPPIPLLQWRMPDPGLDLPFLFLQIAALSAARESSTRLRVWLSGLAFGILFYVYFYLWSMVLVAICLAMLLDSAICKVYRQTLLIGLAIGAPELAYGAYLKKIASPEAVARLGLFLPINPSNITLPVFSVLILLIVGVWIWFGKRSELIYLWSLLAAGIALSRSSIVTGWYLHEYHWDWFWWPVRLIIVLVLIADFSRKRIALPEFFPWGCAGFLILYVASGVYLVQIGVSRTSDGVAQLENYRRYAAQQLGRGAIRLAPGSIIAGDEGFCELASIGENQQMLAGWTLPLDMAIDDATWRSRYTLNAILQGRGREEVAADAYNELAGYRNSKMITSTMVEPFIRQFDQIAKNPSELINSIGVRYVALAVDRPPPAYLRDGWKLVESGPFWRLWERTGRGSTHQNPMVNEIWR